MSLYCMVVIDNNVSPSELTELYRIANDYYGLSSAEINEAVLSKNITFYKPDTIEGRVKYLYELALIAWADGQIRDEERLLLKRYILEFDFCDENADSILEFLLDNAKNKVSPESVVEKMKELN